VPETHETNNLASITAHVLADETPPDLEVTIDGVPVAAGDFVAPRPEIVCSIYDDSPLAIRDTTNVEVFVDENRVSFAGGPSTLRLELLPSGEKRAEVVLHPNLTAGEHTVTFSVTDAFRHRATISLPVQVTEELQLREVMNYPNPFQRETDFTFVLTQPAEEVRIKIYTVAGRLLQTLESTFPRTGFNQVHWDGRDADGDELANGVYLYKIVARHNGRSVEQLEKLVIVR